MAALIIVAIDYLIFYITFSYQRATLAIARSGKFPTKISSLLQTQSTATVQASLTPTALGALGWFNWVTLVIALILLIKAAWWYAVIYVIVRFVITGLLPLIPFNDYIVRRANRKGL